jgi:6-phosphogluconolactonase
VDERAVLPTDNDSNYKLAHDYFITPADFPRRNVHRIHGEIDPDQAAKRYRDELEEFFELQHGGFPVFDAIHCGMGEEGHTASLFPGDAHIEDRTGLTAAVFAPKLPHWRVTLLPGVLLAAKHTLMLVAGADKNPILKQVFHGEYDPWKIPVQLMAREGGNVEWFLDEAAAAGL